MEGALRQGPGVWKRTWDFVTGAATVLFVVGCVAGALYLFTACCAQLPRMSGADQLYSSMQYLKAEFGLDSTKEYHLRLGSTGAGGTVAKWSATTTSEFFLFVGSTTTTTHGQSTPSSTVRMSFRNGNASYILEIPYAVTKFIVTPHIRSSVRFVIDHRQVGSTPKFRTGHHFWTYDPGHWEKAPPIQKSGAWRRVAQIGLPTFLNAHLVRMVLRLTPAQYNAYLGTLQTGK